MHAVFERQLKLRDRYVCLFRQFLSYTGVPSEANKLTRWNSRFPNQTGLDFRIKWIFLAQTQSSLFGQGSMPLKSSLGCAQLLCSKDMSFCLSANFLWLPKFTRFCKTFWEAKKFEFFWLRWSCRSDTFWTEKCIWKNGYTIEIR